MNVSRLDLNLIRILVAIYEEGALTSAAERLFVTQPGLSHALRRARAEFGDELFIRRAGGMEPTTRMTALYPAFADMLRRLEENLSSGSVFDPRTATRQFRLGVNDYGSVVVVPRLLARLAETAPGVSLRCRHTANDAQLRALSEHRIDLAIGVSPGAAPHGVNKRRLFVEDAVGIADRGNRSLGDPVALEAYAAAPHVIMAPDANDRSWVDDRLASLGVTREIAHVTPHFAALFEIVAGSDFVSTAPRRMARQFNAAPRLRLFELPFPPSEHTLSLIWLRRDDGDPGHAWLRETIARVGEELDSEG